MAPVSRKFIVNAMAVAVILGFCTLTAVSVWIAGMSRDLFGPTILVTGTQGQVFTNIGHTLYRLDAQGNLEQRYALAALGLPEMSLTDGLVLPDGRLLLGVAGGRHLYTCRLAEQRCEPFLQTTDTPVAAFKMTWDPDTPASHRGRWQAAPYYCLRQGRGVPAGRQGRPQGAGVSEHRPGDAGGGSGGRRYQSPPAGGPRPGDPGR